MTGIVATPQTFDNNLSLSESIEMNKLKFAAKYLGVETIYFQEGSTVIKDTGSFKVNDLELKAQLRQTSTRG
jgi:membrane fusion protein (multidrug efflux system)